MCSNPQGLKGTGWFIGVVHITPQGWDKIHISSQSRPTPTPPASTSFLSQMKVEAVRVEPLAQELSTVRAQGNKQAIL